MESPYRNPKMAQKKKLDVKKRKLFFEKTGLRAAGWFIGK